jgi:hypothetical protein
MEQRTEINRYVFHVTESFNRESILKKGLFQSGENHFNISNAVYAHNGIIPENCWYPFLLNWNYCILVGFDYWRIDTRELGAEWFLDNVMYRDSVMDTIDNCLYVYTKNHIPAECLTLFTFQESRAYCTQSNGVAHVRRLPEFREHEWTYKAKMKYLSYSIKLQKEQLEIMNMVCADLDYVEQLCRTKNNNKLREGVVN